MSGSIYALASGAVAQKLRLEALSNNLANAGTVGFKMDTVSFRLPESQVIELETPPTTDEPSDLFSDLVPIEAFTDFSQGPHRGTGNPLDIAIEGDGFFAVATDSGIQYTRNGSFTLSPEGILVTHDGYPVMGDGGEITVDGTDIQIDHTGNMVVDGNLSGKLRIVRFSDPQLLEKPETPFFQPARVSVQKR